MRSSSRTWIAVSITVIALAGCMFSAAFASAANGAPESRWSIRTDTFPTNISPEWGGSITVLATDVGGAATNGQPVTITDTLPAGLVYEEVEANEQPGGIAISCQHTESVVTCKYSGPELGPGEFESLPVKADNTDGLSVRIVVVPKPGFTGAGIDTATVSGGGAPPVTVTSDVDVSASEPAFGIAPGSFSANAFDAAGALDTQAGGHPNIDTTGFVLTSVLAPATLSKEETVAETRSRTVLAADLRSADVELPVGFVGNPQAAGTCPQYLINPPGDGTRCPTDSIIGSVAEAKVAATDTWGFSGSVQGSETVKPLFNVPAERGHPAQFEFILENQVGTLYANLVHTDAGYTVQVTSSDVPRLIHLAGIKVTFFGDPAAVDGSGLPARAFFANPSDCAGGPLTTAIQLGSWLGSEAAAQSSSPAPTGCSALRFDPEIEAKPTTAAAGAPSGLDVNLGIPQSTDPTGLATPPLKNVTVTLPRGLSISPSSANGLQACSDEQFAEDTTEPVTCPEASQVGTVKVHTPILANPVEGQVFVGAPECGPCNAADAQSGRMIRLFIQVHSEEYGVTIKIAGHVALDPATGQLTATFQNLIQQPFDKLEFDFKSGQRAPLSTPGCGSYASNVDLTPWSTPYTADANLTPGFQIDEGCGAQGFAPSFTAGTVNPQAGVYSPLTLSFSRSDSQQDFDSLEATLPPGLLAKLAGVLRCGEAEANAGACPESTKIGTVTVSAGPGTDPYTVTGQIYLTGPYNGGPFGEVVEVPAVAGPFNLGVVAVRGSIRVNPSTIQATVVSDPFPQILDGIPLQVRTVSVLLDRDDFTVNPTSCGQQAVTGKLLSTQNATANVSTPFTAVSCASLAFRPDLTASVSGRASKADGAGLDVKVTYPAGPAGTYANTKSVKVDLPKQLPSRLTTLQKACLAATFEANPANCPAASDVGLATAVTPLLNVPVSGPAYLVSHGGEAFPDLEVVLQGEGVTAIVVFNTNIKKGITSSTLKAAPDVPLSSFEIKLPTGKYSILGANLPASAHYSLCGQKLSMPTAITGQNGTPIKQSTKIRIAGCPPAHPKVKKASKKKPGKASKSNRRGK